ncbi:MAG: hypothetical protein DBP02_09795 [gamma proteobacterium symbiont of Ctena orbiculata]|nr:MAG: hypothetical protein DBP02_09795 [gamma proteobacterium symbiont of Ctena orbiculata]PUB90386.1 MAG: hypothetical protein DBP01_07825 [gamma proteobacterium symbiont of Ctena orbiculata]
MSQPIIAGIQTGITVGVFKEPVADQVAVDVVIDFSANRFSGAQGFCNQSGLLFDCRYKYSPTLPIVARIIILFQDGVADFCSPVIQ